LLTFSWSRGSKNGIYLSNLWWAGIVGQMVRHLPSKCKTLTSNLSTIKKVFFSLLKMNDTMGWCYFVTPGHFQDLLSHCWETILHDSIAWGTDNFLLWKVLEIVSPFRAEVCFCST
jgi:hypothetical protein